MKLNALLITIGSHGDVHPFVGLGIALRQRGHDVKIATNGHFEKLIRTAGLGFIELGSDEQFREQLKNPDLWHRTKAFKAVFEIAGLLVEPAYEIVKEQTKLENVVVVASSLTLGARIAQDKLHVPTATVHLAPAVMRTVHDNPKLPGLFMPRGMPHWMKRALWRFGDAVMIDPVVGPMVNEPRRKLGLPPVKGILRDWWNSPDLLMGMWPEWFAPIQPDWPAQTRLVGFPLFDEGGITHLEPKLIEWLNAGEPPIVFCAASAMVHASSFYQASAKACVQLNRRGLFLTRHRDQIPNDLPAMVKHFDYAPFNELLPRCAALVHNGGIGTLSQALRAGVPHLVVPLAHDQLDNADRAERLGVAASIHPRKYTPARVAPLLSQLLGSPQVVESCRQVASKFIGTDSLNAACGLIEALAKDCSSQTPEITSLSTH